MINCCAFVESGLIVYTRTQQYPTWSPAWFWYTDVRTQTIRNHRRDWCFSSWHETTSAGVPRAWTAAWPVCYYSAAFYSMSSVLHNCIINKCCKIVSYVKVETSFVPFTSCITLSLAQYRLTCARNLHFWHAYLHKFISLSSLLHQIVGSCIWHKSSQELDRTCVIIWRKKLVQVYYTGFLITRWGRKPARNVLKQL